MIYLSTFKPPSSPTFGLPGNSCSYTRWFENTSLTTTEQSWQDSSPYFPSFEYTQKSSRKTFSYSHLQIIYTPRAQALCSFKFTKLQTSQSSFKLSLSLSLSLPNHYGNDRTEPPGAAEHIRHSAKVARLHIFHNHHLHSNTSVLPYCLLKIRLPKFSSTLILLSWSFHLLL
jgi:hypothetical protein